jgi:hypothetical protein
MRRCTTRQSPLIGTLLATQLVFNIGFSAVLPFLAVHLHDDLALSGTAIAVTVGVRTFSQQGLFVVGGGIRGSGTDRCSDLRGVRGGAVVAGAIKPRRGWQHTRSAPTTGTILAASPGAPQVCVLLCRLQQLPAQLQPALRCPAGRTRPRRRIRPDPGRTVRRRFAVGDGRSIADLGRHQAAARPGSTPDRIQRAGNGFRGGGDRCAAQSRGRCGRSRTGCADGRAADARADDRGPGGADPGPGFRRRRRTRPIHRPLHTETELQQ